MRQRPSDSQILRFSGFQKEIHYQHEEEHLYSFFRSGECMKMDAFFANLFRGLGDGQMKKIVATGKEIPMKKGQQIFTEGQEVNGVY